jgi:quercetin dioxygenase-like cupin family protein
MMIAQLSIQPKRVASLAILTLGAAVWAFLPHGEGTSAVALFGDICSTISRPMFSSANPVAGIASRPATTSRPLSCEALPNVPGKAITTVVVEFPPLAYSPAHRHPGSVQAVVTAGTIRSQLAGSPPADYQVGQSFFEPPGTLHMFAENNDPVHSATLIATFVTDENCGSLVLPP